MTHGTHAQPGPVTTGAADPNSYRATWAGLDLDHQRHPPTHGPKKKPTVGEEVGDVFKWLVAIGCVVGLGLLLGGYCVCKKRHKPGVRVVAMLCCFRSGCFSSSCVVVCLHSRCVQSLEEHLSVEDGESETASMRTSW